MTNKKAIRLLQHIDYYLKTHTNESCEEEHTALALAIKALDQQLKCGCNTCEYYPMKDQRPQGEWIKITRKGTLPVEYVCSCCGRKIYDDYERSIPMSEFYPFCHCGADMQKGGTE